MLPCIPLHVEGEHAEHHIAQVAHAGEGDEPFQVRLHHAHDGAVNDADDREDRDEGDGVKAALGKSGMANLKKP